jgi:hypothetical protein
MWDGRLARASKLDGAMSQDNNEADKAVNYPMLLQAVSISTVLGLTPAMRFPVRSFVVWLTSIDRQAKLLERCPCRKLKSERIDGAVRLRLAPKARDRLPGPGVGRACPCAEINACEPGCNILGTTEADDEGVVRQRQSRGQDNPVGSNQ